MFKATLFLILCGFAAFAQKNLTLEKNQVALIRTNVDELRLDTLVMKDSSTLLFGGRMTMYLFVNHLLAGKGCVLDGSGKNGRNGDMLPYTNEPIPRRSNLMRADSGWPGWQGTDLFINIKDMILEDSVIILAPGGNGGNGTQVPTLNVFSGRPGVNTSSYNANNPYNGLPGAGGNGGRGGNVMITYMPSIEGDVHRLAVVNPGGHAGRMGEINPASLIPQPFSVLEQQTYANQPWYMRKNTRDGMPGKVKLMKLKE